MPGLPALANCELRNPGMRENPLPSAPIHRCRRFTSARGVQSPRKSQLPCRRARVRPARRLSHQHRLAARRIAWRYPGLGLQPIEDVRCEPQPRGQSAPKRETQLTSGESAPTHGPHHILCNPANRRWTQRQSSSRRTVQTCGRRLPTLSASALDAAVVRRIVHARKVRARRQRWQASRHLPEQAATSQSGETNSCVAFLSNFPALTCVAPAVTS